MLENLNIENLSGPVSRKCEELYAFGVHTLAHVNNHFHPEGTFFPPLSPSALSSPVSCTPLSLASAHTEPSDSAFSFSIIEQGTKLKHTSPKNLVTIVFNIMYDICES